MPPPAPQGVGALLFDARAFAVVTGRTPQNNNALPPPGIARAVRSSSLRNNSGTRHLALEYAGRLKQNAAAKGDVPWVLRRLGRCICWLCVGDWEEVRRERDLVTPAPGRIGSAGE